MRQFRLLILPIKVFLIVTTVLYFVYPLNFFVIVGLATKLKPLILAPGINAARGGQINLERRVQYPQFSFCYKLDNGLSRKSIDKHFAEKKKTIISKSNKIFSILLHVIKML